MAAASKLPASQSKALGPRRPPSEVTTGVIGLKRTCDLPDQGSCTIVGRGEPISGRQVLDEFLSFAMVDIDRDNVRVILAVQAYAGDFNGNI